jgi:hypothetical protein
MVGDLGEWHTVMPTSLSAIERLTPSQLEEYERQILQDWEKSLHYWSGMWVEGPNCCELPPRNLLTRLLEANTRPKTWPKPRSCTIDSNSLSTLLWAVEVLELSRRSNTTIIIDQYA